jgi:hypothetical protein
MVVEMQQCALRHRGFAVEHAGTRLAQQYRWLRAGEIVG